VSIDKQIIEHRKYEKSLFIVVLNAFRINCDAPSWCRCTHVLFINTRVREHIVWCRTGLCNPLATV